MKISVADCDASVIAVARCEDTDIAGRESRIAAVGKAGKGKRNGRAAEFRKRNRNFGALTHAGAINIVMGVGKRGGGGDSGWPVGDARTQGS